MNRSRQHGRVVSAAPSVKVVVRRRCSFLSIRIETEQPFARVIPRFLEHGKRSKNAWPSMGISNDALVVAPQSKGRSNPP